MNNNNNNKKKKRLKKVTYLLIVSQNKKLYVHLQVVLCFQQVAIRSSNYAYIGKKGGRRF